MTLPSTIHLSKEDKRWLSGDWTGFTFRTANTNWLITGMDKLPDGNDNPYDWCCEQNGEPEDTMTWNVVELESLWLHQKLDAETTIEEWNNKEYV